MMESNQLIGIIFVLAGLFDVVIFPRIIVRAMKKQNQPGNQNTIARVGVFVVGLIMIALGIAFYAGVID